MLFRSLIYVFKEIGIAGPPDPNLFFTEITIGETYNVKVPIEYDFIKDDIKGLNKDLSIYYTLYYSLEPFYENRVGYFYDDYINQMLKCGFITFGNFEDGILKFEIRDNYYPLNETATFNIDAFIDEVLIQQQYML